MIDCITAIKEVALSQANRSVLDMAVPAFVGALAATVGTAVGRQLVTAADKLVNWQSVACPRCGARIEFRIGSTSAHCHSCGTGFRVS